MKKLTQWVLAATLTFCGAMMMLTSCTDAIGSMDNPVNPEQPDNPADELAKETFFHEDWMDRSVKPGDFPRRQGQCPALRCGCRVRS